MFARLVGGRLRRVLTEQPAEAPAAVYRPGGPAQHGFEPAPFVAGRQEFELRSSVGLRNDCKTPFNRSLE